MKRERPNIRHADEFSRPGIVGGSTSTSDATKYRLSISLTRVPSSLRGGTATVLVPVVVACLLTHPHRQSSRRVDRSLGGVHKKATVGDSPERGQIHSGQ